MLLEFSMKNFQSYKNEVTFDMTASSTVKECENGGMSNVSYLANGTKILRTAAIYGANGSGKSTLLDAFTMFKDIVMDSNVNQEIVKEYSDNYYAFDTDSANEPISMEMVFLIDDTKYRLGFEILKGKVLTEWLFKQSLDSSKESYCYKREKSEIKINNKIIKGARGIDSKTRGNALFISTAAQFNVEVANNIRNWFRKKFRFFTNIEDTIRFTAKSFLSDPQFKKDITEIIHQVDPCIKNMDVHEDIFETSLKDTLPPAQILQKMGLAYSSAETDKVFKRHEMNIITFHDLYNDENIVDSIPFSMENESYGTKKLFALLGPFFYTINTGGILIIDEFGASLHTQLTMELVKLFHSSINKNGAQLIVATHDTNLLRKEILRRDQIWFTEKNNKGESDLYSLVEYKINQANSVRNDASFSKDYLLGRYGAIPFFGNLNKFIIDYGKREENE